MVHPSTSTSHRREREREQRRALILGAAERIFACAGFHDASVEQIAAEAELATGTIYLYFINKEALYAAVFEEKIAEKIDYIEKEARATRDPLDGLRRAVRAQLVFYDQHRAFFEIFLRQNPVTPPPGQASAAVAPKQYQRHLALLRELIEAAQRQKKIRPLQSQKLAPLLIGMAVQITRDGLLQDPREPLADQAELVLELFLHGVAAK